MKKTGLVVVLIIAVVAIIGLNYFLFNGGSGGGTNVKEEMCGVTKAESLTLVKNVAGQQDPSRLENDDAFVCMGKNVINNCKPSYALISGAGSTTKIKFKLMGMADGKCRTRIDYPTEDQITNENEKIFAGKYSECNLDMKNLTLTAEAKDKPGAVGAASFVLTTFTSLFSKTDCNGTLPMAYQFNIK